MARKSAKKQPLPISYWSHSSLMAFLRNPLTWYKRYVEHIYDIPTSPSAAVGRAGHAALEMFYKGANKEDAIAYGLRYLRGIADFELNFGAATSKKARREKRLSMEREYLQAIGFYLAKPPRHAVLGVEVRGVARIKGLRLPVKAISDLVVESRAVPGAVDVVDHKFVDSFSKQKGDKTLFVMQALFNYYVAEETFGRPVARFIVYECKKKRNANGGPQLRRYVINYADLAEEFRVFHRLLKDATDELARPRRYLPNPSDMFEGEESFALYRLGLVENPNPPSRRS